MTYSKKLIEVALPLDAINAGCKQEKNPFLKGHPRSLHLWWARRPLAAARAVIFAQMVDDPSAHPEQFPTEADQERERLRLFKIIEQLVLWENTTNEDVLNAARDEIWKSWRAACAANRDHPRAAELFNPDRLPAFHDPFAGGGALPLEAQRLGLEAYASDLNPVAVLINKAMIEIPPKFANRPPVNPTQRRKGAGTQSAMFEKEWRGAQGLAEDVRYYGQWMRDEAEKRIGHLYPKITITAEMVQERPDLKPYVGRSLTVIAWLWARTVKSPNPAFADVDVPLASTFILSKKTGKETYIEPVIEGRNYRFSVKVGQLPKSAENGTKLARADFQCLVSGSPISGDYLKAEGQAGRMGSRLMAIVAEGDLGRVYLAPNAEHETIARQMQAEWRPELTISGSTQYLGVKPYGMERFDQIFTDRQLIVLKLLTDLLTELSVIILQDTTAALGSANISDRRQSLADGGTDAFAYAEAVLVYLACGISQLTRYSCCLCSWNRVNENVVQAFGRQAISMVWDYAESHPLDGSLAINITVNWVADALGKMAPFQRGFAEQKDAASSKDLSSRIISTDPPYYDNVPYADLSDFFYIWLRLSLQRIFPDLFATLAVPKTEELVAFAHRHKSRAAAQEFFLDGMKRVMHSIAKEAHPEFPITIFYAFRQSETNDMGTVSTGWGVFLNALICIGYEINGTWPMRTERDQGLKSIKNSLASSIVLVCRKRPADAPTATRREFLAALRAELPTALKHLQRGNIAPVDLAQAAIGPGMGVFTRYARVLDAAGQPMSVREALALINQTLDEVLAEQEGDFDPETRWAVAWFEQMGFNEGPFGDAETLSKAKNTSVETLAEAGLLASRAGKVRLFRPSELPAEWQPKHDARLTIWEMTHHLIRVLEKGGESGAAALAAQLGSQAETARELAYRLYTVCERKKRAQEALAYNALVQSWPEITRLAAEKAASGPVQESLFG